jgi:SulP family sulfate permease
VVTFLLTLGLGIKEGILLGVLLSLLLLVYRISKPHIAVLGQIRGTEYFRNLDRFATDAEDPSDFLILRFDGQLFFGNKDYFREQLQKQIARKGSSLKYIILNAEAISYIDSTAVFMLRALIQELKKESIRFAVAGAIGPTRDILHTSGLIDDIGRENLFANTNEAFTHLRELGKRSEIGTRIATQTASRIM